MIFVDGFEPIKPIEPKLKPLEKTKVPGLMMKRARLTDSKNHNLNLQYKLKSKSVASYQHFPMGGFIS